MSRGMLTEEIKKKSKDFLGREINTRELRLYAFIDYCLKNNGKISHQNTNEEEIEILMKLDDEGHLWVSSRTNLTIYTSQEFYDFMQEILYISYVQNKKSELPEEVL